MNFTKSDIKTIVENISRRLLIKEYAQHLNDFDNDDNDNYLSDINESSKKADEKDAEALD